MVRGRRSKEGRGGGGGGGRKRDPAGHGAPVSRLRRRQRPGPRPCRRGARPRHSPPRASGAALSGPVMRNCRSDLGVNRSPFGTKSAYFRPIHWIVSQRFRRRRSK